MGVLYTALIGFGCISHSLQKGYLYTYTYVGLSAFSFRTDRAMRRPTNRGTSDRLAPRFFILYIRQLKNNPAVVARQPS